MSHAPTSILRATHIGDSVSRGRSPRPVDATPPLTHQQGQAEHSRLLPRRASVVLPAEVARVRDARHFATAVLAQWGLNVDDHAAALLVVGELAANAAQHGRSSMLVGLAVVGSTLQIDVCDFGALVRRGPAAPADERGRGLAIVDCLADSTVTCHAVHGRRVHAVLSLSLPVTRSGV
ncbi:ATP-binding protein [Streptomyces albidoflavus]|uniref:ATP-binding protein n=1 Tax=Streptomyces albidoflavus TaxID=1886 RepID=UPI00101E6E36|nr:ATP-binding protein [Streptomyces albidoflavus]RZD76774.1 ATP-binding protein [Streptomyces albidoflavus]